MASAFAIERLELFFSLFAKDDVLLLLRQPHEVGESTSSSMLLLIF